MVSNELFTKLNLPKHHAVSLEALVWYDKESGALDAVRHLVDRDPFYVATATYRRGKLAHQYRESLFVDEEFEYPVFSRITYDVVEDEPLGSRTSLMQSICKIVEHIRPSHSRCSVQFVFDDPAHFEDIFFELPVEYEESRFGGLDWPMDELRGIRGVKYADSEGQQRQSYSFILDRPTGTDLFVSITFEDDELLDCSLTSRVLDRAITVRSQMGIL